MTPAPLAPQEQTARLALTGLRHAEGPPGADVAEAALVVSYLAGAGWRFVVADLSGEGPGLPVALLARALAEAREVAAPRPRDAADADALAGLLREMGVGLVHDRATGGAA